MRIAELSRGCLRIQRARKCFILLGVAVLLGAGGACMAAPAPTEVLIHDDRPFPESITSTSNGTLIIGSLAKGMVFRAAPGAATAEPWIHHGTNGLDNVLGVLADERSGTLWVCSFHQGDGPGEPTALKAFNLTTGAAKGSYTFPGNGGICNDIAVSRDGNTYATDTLNGRILRLKPGASALEVWVKDHRLVSADGIVFGDDSTLYVNTFESGHLFRVPVGVDGKAGSIVRIHTSQPLTRPDGMRPLRGNEFLMIEGAGRLDRVVIEGDTARIQVLKDGFKGPTAVTRIGDTGWVIEGKLNYLDDPKLKHQDPGLFKVYAVRLGSGLSSVSR
jgi:sugar lactone lactonase YvrE